MCTVTVCLIDSLTTLFAPSLSEHQFACSTNTRLVHNRCLRGIEALSHVLTLHCHWHHCISPFSRGPNQGQCSCRVVCTSLSYTVHPLWVHVLTYCNTIQVIKRRGSLIRVAAWCVLTLGRLALVDASRLVNSIKAAKINGTSLVDAVASFGPALVYRSAKSIRQFIC